MTKNRNKLLATRAQPSMEKALPSVSMVRVDTASTDPDSYEDLHLLLL